MIARLAHGVVVLTVCAVGLLVAWGPLCGTSPQAYGSEDVAALSSPALSQLRGAHQKMLSWFGRSRHRRGWEEYLQTDRLREQMKLGEQAREEVVQEILARYTADHAGLGLARFRAVRVALERWLEELSLPTLGELPDVLRSATDSFVPLDALVSAPKQRTREALAVLEEFLGHGRRGIGWRGYLRFDELAAQLRDDATLDVELLDDVLARLSAEHAGLELPQFANVRKALAAYLAVARQADNPETEVIYQLHLKRLAGLIAMHGSRPDRVAYEQINESLDWLEDCGQIPELAPLLRRHLNQPKSSRTHTPLRQPVRLISAAKEQRLRRLLPIVDDPTVQQVLDDPTLILYTDAEMPKAYQIWDGELQGVHLANYNISADGGEPYGNGNYEFPWGKPAGTHRTEGVSTFRFLWLPRDEEGTPWPVVWYTKHIRGDSQSSYAWTFPVGTVVGEVLSMRGPDGYAYTFEMRLRFRRSDHWGVDVFRPFPTTEHLAQRIHELRPDASYEPKLAGLLRHLESPAELAWRQLADAHPTRRAFSQWSGVDVLPAIDDDQLVSELLTTTAFTSCLGQAWRTGSNGPWTFAPTTRSQFHIVPANYSAGFVEVNRTSCIRCHETTNQHVNRFDFGRDWYGHIRGSDGIFSFHPFDPSTLSGNGFSGGVSMRGTLTRTGVLQRYNRDKHPRSRYTRIPRLEG